MSEEIYVGQLSREDRVRSRALDSWISVYKHSDLPEAEVQKAHQTYSRRMAEILRRYGVAEEEMPAVLVCRFTGELTMLQKEAS